MIPKTELISPELNNLIEVSFQIYSNLLGYSIEQTSLKVLNKNKWENFCNEYHLDFDSKGIYLPRNQTAIIPKNNELSLFHEYFGHGLYCEQSLTGRRLVELEKKLLEEEKEFFDGRNFTKEDLKNFRKENKTFNYLNNFRKENLGIYEEFAVFSEYFLSKKFKLNMLFERKYKKLNRDFRDYIGKIISFNEKFGDLATFYEFGLGKIQDKERLLKLSKDIFNSKLNETNLILHFGSGKPFSDIDFFIISNNIEPFYCDWLDIRAYKPEDAEEKIRLLDSRVTDPIIFGSLIFGNEEYLSKLKEKVLAQPITEEAIKYNLEMAEYSKKRYLDSSLEKTLQAKNLKSSKIYLANALALKNGEKLLTVKRLVDYAKKRFSHSERFIELKGGIK